MLVGYLTEGFLIFQGYKEALQQFPDDSRILLNLGSSYHMMGERHKARQYYEKALALNPSNSLAQTNLALLQWEQTNKTLGSSWFWDQKSLSTSFQNDIWAWKSSELLRKQKQITAII